jgi:hypothetical protein
MSVPLRKDELIDEDLTTADLAQGKRPSLLDDRPIADRLIDDLPIDDRRADDRRVEDRSIKDRPLDDQLMADRPGDGREEDRKEGRLGPVLAERRADEGSQAATSDLKANVSEARNVPDGTPLFPSNELAELRSRWSGVQTAFVDEPRRAVEQADGLVASAMKRLAEVFAEERSKLEHQWDRGEDVSTEDLRIALQRYRTFFHRLLSI